MKKSVLQGSALLFAIALTAVSSACYTQTVSTSHPPPTVEGSPPPSSGPVAAPTPGVVQLPPNLPSLSPGVAEIVKLAQSQLGEETMLNFINQSPQAFNPTAEELIFLADIGVSNNVINALIRKSGSSMTAEDVAPSSAPAPQVSAQPTPAPAPASAQPTAAAIESAPAGQAPAVVYTAAPQQVVEQPQQVVYAPAQQVETQTVVYEIEEPVTYFQPALEPYGTWVDVAPYGRCWQPTVATLNVNWQPYGDRGRWLDTDYGWYWQSDYSWGWAPFHYGRWHRHNHHGWVWTPGRDWGPAWVSWRRSDAYCGWAPLPPFAHYRSGFGFSYHNAHVGIHFDYGLSSHHYTYLSLRHLHSHHPHHHYLDRHRSHVVHNQTRVINHHHGSRSGTHVNRGVSRDEISQLTRQEIKRVRVLDRPANGRSVVQPDRLVKTGDSLAIYRGAPRTAAAGSTRAPRGNGSGASRSETGRPTATTAANAASGARRDGGAPVTRSIVGRTTASPSNGQAAGSRAAVPASPPQAPTTASSTRTQGGAPLTLRPRPAPRARSGSARPTADSAQTRNAVPRQTSQPSNQGLSLAAPRPITSTPGNPRIQVGGLATPTPITSTPSNPRADAKNLTPPRPITSAPGNPRITVGNLTPPAPVTSQPTNPALPSPVLTVPRPVTSTPQQTASPAPRSIVRAPGSPARTSPQIRPVPTPTRPSSTRSSGPQLSVTSNRRPNPSPSVPTPSRSAVPRHRPATTPQRSTQFKNSSAFQNPSGSSSRVQSRAPVYSTRSAPTTGSSSRVAPRTRTQQSTARPTYTRPTPSRPTYTRPTVSPSRTPASRPSYSRPAVSPSRAAPSRSTVSPSRSAPSPSRAAPSRATPSRATPSRATPSRSAPSQATPSRATPSRSAPPSRTSPSRRR